jgi:uncharacterized protein YndB with AHSA1/START domain/DNA-binding transcriptional ArsR family regulator
MGSDPLNSIFAALADPTRRAILARLAEGEASVGELARPFALSLPTVSRHIDVLETAGLVARAREAQRRVCRLQGEPLMQAGEWISRYVAYWEARLAALEQLLRDLEEGERRRMLETKGEVLRLERRFAAPRRLVFDAVTRPALLRRWMCPEGHAVTEIVAEPEPGGRFRLAMEGPDGRVYRVAGEYREVEPPVRVVFGWTWGAGHSMAAVPTTMTIELFDFEGGTRLVMTHTGLASVAERESHRGGWTEALAKLQRLIRELS